jgi:hypothetical protein
MSKQNLAILLTKINIMKTIFLFMFFALAGCSNDDAKNAIKLPPETQTGANTFGVTINGKVYIPRDPTRC